MSAIPSKVTCFHNPFSSSLSILGSESNVLPKSSVEQLTVSHYLKMSSFNHMNEVAIWNKFLNSNDVFATQKSSAVVQEQDACPQPQFMSI